MEGVVHDKKNHAEMIDSLDAPATLKQQCLLKIDKEIEGTIRVVQKFNDSIKIDRYIIRYTNVIGSDRIEIFNV